MIGEQEDSELMDRVIDKLELAKAARKEAEEKLKEARADLADRESELKSAHEEAKAKADMVRSVETRDVIGIVRKTFIPEERIREATDLLQDYLGIRGARDLAKQGQVHAGEFMDLVGETRVAAARGQSAWAWLARAPVKRAEIAGLLLVFAIVLGGGWWLAATYKNEIGEAWPVISTIVLEAGAMLAMITQWAKRHLGKVSKGLDQFDNFRHEVDQKFAEEKSKFQKEVDEAQKVRDRAETAVRAAEARRKEAEAQVAEAEKELSESRSAHRIARLVEKRLAGKDYEQYLGIVAAIRADFEKLSDLMKELSKEPAAPDSIRGIERIVLYIDDLDRCPSNQVVAVLEAIHLLLAFELFVVVVGVDIRWAARSLAEKYPHHLTAGAYEAGAEGPRKTNESQGASALDYLEKIFQIPFWLPPMDEQASRYMIAEMIPAALPATDEPKEQKSEANLNAASENVGQAKQPAKTTAAPSPPKAESLRIELEERLFMLDLAGAVGKSPRRLKRFVNTYRILKASNNALEMETFVLDHGAKGEYRAAMMLLALVTGAPRSALGTLSLLEKCNDDDSLADFSQKTLGSGSVDADEAPYVQSALDAYIEHNHRETDQLRDLRYWGPRAARFGFRSGRM